MAQSSQVVRHCERVKAKDSELRCVIQAAQQALAHATPVKSVTVPLLRLSELPGGVGVLPSRKVNSCPKGDTSSSRVYSSITLSGKHNSTLLLRPYGWGGCCDCGVL